LSKASLLGARIDAKALSEAILEFTVMPNGECVTHAQESRPTVPNLVNVMSYTRLTATLDPYRGMGTERSDPAALLSNATITAISLDRTTTSATADPPTKTQSPGPFH